MENIIYDKNLSENKKADTNRVKWYKVCYKDFDIYGLVEDDEILSRRIPKHVAKNISAAVLGMSGYGAGGRILFSTDSPFVALKVTYLNGRIPTVSNNCYCYGFTLYESDEYGQETYIATYRSGDNFDLKNEEYSRETQNNGEIKYYTLNMPHFSEVKDLYIGIYPDSILGKGKKYFNDSPIIYYGSSITHGVAASNTGNTYQNFISQKYNLDYVNLGFAGSALGEETFAGYIAGLDMCMFVCDYDHNAPDTEHLRKTHYRFYEIIREKHPTLPYIMISKPDFFANIKENQKRKNIIIASYNKAEKSGDKNVYFIDGERLFDGESYTSCTADGCHPNDLGFFRMANEIGCVISKILDIEK